MANYNPETHNYEYALDYRLEAVRLFAETGRYRHTIDEMEKRHPERVGPQPRTLKKWVKKYEAVAEKKKFVSGKPQEAWLEVELAALDKLLDTVRGGDVPANILYAIAGVAADKRLKSLELDKGKTTNVRHFHELVTERRNQLIAEAQAALDTTVEEAEAVVDLQENYTPLLSPPSGTVRLDLDNRANVHAR